MAENRRFSSLETEKPVRVWGGRARIAKRVRWKWRKAYETEPEGREWANGHSCGVSRLAVGARLCATIPSFGTQRPKGVVE